MKTYIITYQSPDGSTIDLSERQITALRSSGRWPRDHTGQEYCTVSHGLHHGEPVDDRIIGLTRCTVIITRCDHCGYEHTSLTEYRGVCPRCDRTYHTTRFIADPAPATVAAALSGY